MLNYEVARSHQHSSEIANRSSLFLNQSSTSVKQGLRIEDL